MLALAGGDLEQALVWTDGRWSLTHQYLVRNAPTIIAAANVVITGAGRRSPAAAISEAFVRMYGADAVEAASAAMSGKRRFMACNQ